MRRQASTIPALENEVVLAPQSLTEDDAKALATALHADLTRIGDRWRFFRRSETAEALKRADAAWLRGRIDAVVRRMDAFARTDAKDPNGAPLAALRAARARFEARTRDVLDDSGNAALERTPAAHLLVDLLRRFPDEIVRAATPESVTALGGSVVLSNAPVGLECSLRGADGAIERYVARQGAFAEWAERHAVDVPEAYRWAFPKGVFRPGPRTILLRTVRSATEPVFALAVYDPTGRSEGWSSLTARERDDALPTKVDHPLGRVALPAETLSALRRATPGEPEFVPETLDPVAHEPLDLLVRDALLLWGRAKGYDRVVGCIPDDLLDAARACVSEGTLNLDDLTRALDRAGCESVPSGKTLVVRPVRPLQEEATRADRKPLATLCRAAMRGALGLDQICDYHAAFDRRPTLPRSESVIVSAFGLNHVSDWSLPHPFLAALGALPPAERRRLVAGGRVALGGPTYERFLFDLVQFAGYLRASPSPPVAPSTTVYSNFRTATISVRSDLERTPLRLLARIQSWGMESVARAPYPMVRAVSKTDDKIANPFFVSPSLFPGPASGLYNYFWVLEQPIEVKVVLGDVVEAGPFRLKERISSPRGPVPYEQIPGLQEP